MTTRTADADAIVIGAGLAGLVATAELGAAGRSALLRGHEPEQNLGGQAFWSFGGPFLVDSPEQRRMGIRDSHEPAWADALTTGAGTTVVGASGRVLEASDAGTASFLGGCLFSERQAGRVAATAVA